VCEEAGCQVLAVDLLGLATVVVVVVVVSDTFGQHMSRV
jgi:hypothetical protein